jgi:hypothetical protein
MALLLIGNNPEYPSKFCFQNLGNWENIMANNPYQLFDKQESLM